MQTGSNAVASPQVSRRAENLHKRQISGRLQGVTSLTFGFMLGVTAGLSSIGFTLLWPITQPEALIDASETGSSAYAAHVRLLRSILMTLHDANRSGNYSVLHALAAPAFQSVNSVDRLAQIFTNLRDLKADLSFVSFSRPHFDQPPYIDAAGILWMKGTYPEVPFATRFTLAFIKVAGDWRLVEIGIQRD